MVFAVSADHRGKLKESKKKDKYQDLARELKKHMEHENKGDTICNWISNFPNHFTSYFRVVPSLSTMISTQSTGKVGGGVLFFHFLSFHSVK